MGSAQGSVTAELEQARSAPEFGAHTPLAEKLLAVAIRAQNFTGSSGVAIALAEGQEMVCRANWGTSAPEVGAKLSNENSFTGLCVRRGEPLRCDDAQTDPRVDHEACRALGLSAIAVAPIRRGLKVIGVIAAFSDTPHAFTDKHLLILTTLSEVIVELLDDPQPVRPLPQTVDAAASDLMQATGVAQAPAPRVEKPAMTSVQEPAPPVLDIPTGRAGCAGSAREASGGPGARREKRDLAVRTEFRSATPAAQSCASTSTKPDRPRRGSRSATTTSQARACWGRRFRKAQAGQAGRKYAGARFQPRTHVQRIRGRCRPGTSLVAPGGGSGHLRCPGGRRVAFATGKKRQCGKACFDRRGAGA